MRPWQGGGRPSAEEVRHLVEDEGYSDKQLADHYGVTEATAWYYRTSAGITKEHKNRLDHRASGAVPWKLNTKLNHHRDPIARLLRARARGRAGMPQAEDVSRRVQRFEEDLAALNVVVAYDRESGFYTVDRDPKIDDPDSIVRMPDV